jgi:hypothetical protein
MSKFGWRVDVLSVDPSYVDVPQDAWLQAGVPEEVQVHRSHALPLRFASIPGFGTITLRAKEFLRRKGNALLGNVAYDLIYFSTTAFGLFSLGPYWKKRFGVPFVVDYQDPWITDYYRKHPKIVPPGGRMKYGIVERLSRFREPRVLRQCAGMTAVSQEYAKELINRYPWFAGVPKRVLPFPGSQRDFERIVQEQVQQQIFDCNDGAVHWVAVGVSGPIMYKALSGFFRALADARSGGRLPNRLRLHFIGTSYAAPGTSEPVVIPIAKRFGVSDLVHEQTDRVPFSTALRLLLDSNALLAFGSDDPSYNASKLLPYLLAKKPLLTVFHGESPAVELLRNLQGSRLVEFCEADREDEIAKRVKEIWLDDNRHSISVPIVESALAKHTDYGQAKELCGFFDSVVDAGATGSHPVHDGIM